MSTQPVNCGTSFCSCIECVALPREWVGLTDEEIWGTGSKLPISKDGIINFFRVIEAKLKEKNAL